MRTISSKQFSTYIQYAVMAESREESYIIKDMLDILHQFKVVKFVGFHSNSVDNEITFRFM